jgi:hypothetical protein
MANIQPRIHVSAPPREALNYAPLLNPMGATDDVELLYEQEPPPQPNQAVFLHNKNTSLGVVATLAWTADKNFNLQRLNGVGPYPFSPWEQVIRVPPKGQIYVGRELFYRVTAFPSPADPVFDVITRSFSIKDPKYTSSYYDPLPPPSDVETYLYIYKITTSGRYVHIAVNQNSEFEIDAQLRCRELLGAVTVFPSGQQNFFASSIDPVWTVDLGASSFRRYP